jgi:hypothetical protein
LDVRGGPREPEVERQEASQAMSDPEARNGEAVRHAFYQRALRLLVESGVPFLVGGAYAFQRYTGVARDTRDFDVFLRPGDVTAVLDRFARAGYRIELTFPHWLAKVREGDAYVDLIFSSGNGVAQVDELWFEHGVEDVVLEVPVRLVPVEEMLWSKGFVMERERFDGADIHHLLRARADQLDWKRLLWRYGPHARVLLSHLVLFGFVYPSERDRVPAWVLEELIERLRQEIQTPPPAEPVCQGTLLSRSQYLADLERGYLDARLPPRGRMSADDVRWWTEAGERDAKAAEIAADRKLEAEREQMSERARAAARRPDDRTG